jgi:hypothetical protein
MGVAGDSQEAWHASKVLCEALLAAWQGATAMVRRKAADGVVCAVWARSMQQMG